MLLFILMYLRKAMTQDVSMDQPVANKWIHLLLPIVNEALADLGELPSREREPSVSDESSQTPSVDAPVSHLFFS